jgi:hypothetical protein
MVMASLNALGLSVMPYCRKHQRGLIDTFVLQGPCSVLIIYGTKIAGHDGLAVPELTIKLYVEL